MSELQEKNIEYLSALLSHNNFSGAKIILDIIINSINKENFDSNIQMIKEAIVKGRENRSIDIKNKADQIISIINDSKDEDLTHADQEAMLIVYIAQAIYGRLELDNMVLYSSQAEIDDIQDTLDSFVNGSAIGDWFYKDDSNWRDKIVKTY